MNKWECDFPGCKSSAVGCGGAIGLRAIGWHFQRGAPIPPGADLRTLVAAVFDPSREPVLLCPRHRPDPIACRDREEGSPVLCALCAGDREADQIQSTIGLKR